MSQFRKKPVVIEAVQWTGSRVAEKAPSWLGEAIDKPWGDPGSIVRSGDTLTIHTLEGAHRADPGDWIIRGVKGELYPCKPDIFEATYEPASSVPSTLHGQEPK